VSLVKMSETKAMDTTSVAKVVDDILQRHDREILSRLETWLSELEVLLDRRIERRSGLGRRGVSEMSSLMCSEEVDFEQKVANESEIFPQVQGSQALSELVEPTFSSNIQSTGTVKQNGGISSRQISRRFSIKSYEDAIQEADRIEKLKRSQSMVEQAVQEPPSTSFPCFQDLRRRAARLVGHPCFDLFFLSLILANSVYLGVQLEWSATFDQASEEVWMAITVAFSAIFTVEILIRLFASGPKSYIWSRGCWWNWLDLVVVSFAWAEVAGQYMSSENGSESSNSNMRIIRIFRIGKLLQSVRSFRVLKFLTALRILVYSIVDATRSLFWALLLLMIAFYIFGLLFTDAVLQHLEVASNPNCCDLLKVYFGSVSKSMTTLFRSILGGIDWNSPADALAEVDEAWKQLFHVYIGLAMLALLNVMIGVFCNSTIRAAELNHEVMLENRIQLRAKAAKLFRRMDETGSGSLTLTEFERAFDQESMKAFLESIDINATDAWTLFDSLTLDGNSVLTLEEFTEGCLLLKGPARSVDMYALKQNSRKIGKQLKQGFQQVQQEIRGLGTLRPAKPETSQIMEFESWKF